MRIPLGRYKNLCPGPYERLCLVFPVPMSTSVLHLVTLSNDFSRRIKNRMSLAVLFVISCSFDLPGLQEIELIVKRRKDILKTQSFLI